MTAHIFVDKVVCIIVFSPFAGISNHQRANALWHITQIHTSQRLLFESSYPQHSWMFLHQIVQWPFLVWYHLRGLIITHYWLLPLSTSVAIVLIMDVHINISAGHGASGLET